MVRRRTREQLLAALAIRDVTIARLIAVLTAEHMRVREMASRWYDHLPPEARAELHRIANELLAPLLREPARRSSSQEQ